MKKAYVATKTAYIESINEFREIELGEHIGNNVYLAKLDGKECRAVYTPFHGSYTVYDI